MTTAGADFLVFAALGGFGDTALASVLAAAIAGLVAWATSISAKKGQVAAAQAAAEAAVASQTVSSRTDIEKEAFERAKNFYTDTLDRQDKMIAARDTKIIDLEGKVVVQGEHIDSLQDEVDELREERVKDHREMDTMRQKLEVATRLLEQKYPDEN